MNAEVLAYPFLFIAIFFESFILVTFLSKPARAGRARRPGTSTPSVAIVVPCYNEAATVARTTESLLALDYPKDRLSVLLVDDGSKDATRLVMEQFRANGQVTIIHKENGGKHTALNAGIAATRAEFIGCLDADSFVEPDALREIIPCFANQKVAATTAAMSVHEPKSIIQYMQNAEYIFGITLRHVLSSVNGIYVTPGPFSLYRASALKAVGDFRYGYQTEDMEMALRLQKEGYLIENAPLARVYTKAPSTIPRLLKQRTRWTTGFLRNIFNEYRGLIGNRGYGALGTIVLPVALTAIGSGIGMFLVCTFLLGANVVEAYQIRSGIPLAYSLVPHQTFDWFYLPASLFISLSVIAIAITISFIVIGKHLSKTPTPLTRGILSYLLLYGFIAPLWLMRSVFDVALHKTRAWR